MSQTRAPAFSFKVGSHEAKSLSVSHISGREGLSRLYEFQVGFHPLVDEPMEAQELLGAEALLTVLLPEGKTRHVHGRVRAVDTLGQQQGGRWRYQAWVVPTAWWLTRVQRSRIFQGKTVPQIVKAVLEAGDVEVKLSLSGSYAARDYCTQYRETDFAFVSRLMEWEGLFYFFQHTEEGHILVVGDKPNVHEALPGGAKLPLRGNDGRAKDGEYLSSLQRVHRLRPGNVHLKDYDFEKPALDVSGKTQDSSNGQDMLEVYEYPGEYVAPDVGKGAAKVRLEEMVQAARTVEGEGVCPRLTPGYRFEVEDAGTHEGEYVVVEVAHSSQQLEARGIREALGNLYRNSFKCMPAKVPYRPRRTTPVPHIPGVQTATVVGPWGEEIHTDEYGRIKVQFHWDREGQRDDKASCWVRMGQTWGGQAWGALFLPRIGQEVVVRFLEGNPDKPLIAGTVYNGGNPTPYALPDEKTKSTLKSASSLGSNGFNEFRIEDATGEEEIFVHGQKDATLFTEDDKRQELRGNEILLVKKDRQIIVEDNQLLLATADDSSHIDLAQSLQVLGNRNTITTGGHREVVDGNQVINVGREHSETVLQAATETVGGTKSLIIGTTFIMGIGLDMNETIGGIKSDQTNGDHIEFVIGSRQESITQDKHTQVGDNFQTEVKGQAHSVVGKNLKEEINARHELSIHESATRLSKSIELKADKFSLTVGDHLILSIEKTGTCKLHCNTLTVDCSDTKLKGSKVKKESAGSRPGASTGKSKIHEIGETKSQPLTFSLKNSDGQAMADVAYELILPDGTVKKGRTNSIGQARIEDLPPGVYKIAFPEFNNSLS